MQAPSHSRYCVYITQLGVVVQERATVMDLSVLFCSVLQIHQTLSSACLKALLATNQQLRQYIRLQSTALAIGKHKTLAISVANQWPSVQHLHLHSICLCGKDMWGLSQSCWMGIKSLDFTTAHLDVTAMACLVTADWPLLQHLNLCGQNMTPASMAVFSMSKRPELRYLNLQSCSLEASSMMQLVAADWPNLEYLVLAQNTLTAPALLQLSKGRWSGLSKLDLRQTSFDVKALSCSAAGKWPSMCSILLSQTQDAACGLLCRMQHVGSYC